MFEIDPPVLAVPIVLAIAGACVAAGEQVLRWLRAEAESPASRIAFAAALGLGILSYLVLAIGLAGWLSTASVSIVIGALAILGGPSYARWVRKRPPRNVTVRRAEPHRLLSVALLAVVVAAALLTLVGSLAPPISDDWDGLAYHLADAKLYLDRGRISPIWFQSHSNFPFTVEMLFVAGLALKSVSIAKGLSWVFWLAGVLGVYGLTRSLAGESGSRWCGLAGATVFAATPIVLWEATSSYVDVAAAVFLVLAAHALLVWRRSDVRGWLIVAGLFAGWALGTKMTVLLPVVLLGGCALWWSKAVGPRRAGHALAFVGIALAVASPWYIKSYVWTGNPVYPFFYSVFDGKNWAAENAEAYRAQQATFGNEDKGLGQLIRTPWDLAVHPEVYYDKVSDNPTVIYLLSLGALFVTSVPVFVLGFRWRRETMGLAALVGVAFLAWFFQVQYLRYLVPLLGIAAALIGASTAALSEARRGARTAVWIFCAFIFAVSTFHVGLLGRWVSADRLNVVVGREPQREYLRARLAIFPMAEFINAEIPQESKVIMYHEVFGLYLDREYMWGNPRHHTLIDYDSFRTAEDFVVGLRGQGVTHVLVNERFTPQGVPSEAWARLLYGAIWTGRAVPIYSERGYTLFELEAP